MQSDYDMISWIYDIIYDTIYAIYEALDSKIESHPSLVEKKNLPKYILDFH